MKIGPLSSTHRQRAPDERTYGLSRGPILETNRLILRRLRASDFDRLFQMASDPRMWRFPERDPMTSDEAWNMLLRHEGSWSITGYGVFVIEKKADGDFIGLAGFSDFRRRIDPCFDCWPEVTWSILPEVQGRGYATEAGKAAIGWIERALRRERSVGLIHPDNAPSLAVAAKLGYHWFRTIRYKDQPAHLLTRCASR